MNSVRHEIRNIPFQKVMQTCHNDIGDNTYMVVLQGIRGYLSEHTNDILNFINESIVSLQKRE